MRTASDEAALSGLYARPSMITPSTVQTATAARTATIAPTKPGSDVNLSTMNEDVKKEI